MEDILLDYNSGMKLKDICIKHNTTLPTIYEKLRNANIVPNRNWRGLEFSNEQIKEIVRMYFIENKTQEQIANELDKSIVSVAKYVNKYKKEIMKTGAENLLKN